MIPNCIRIPGMESGVAGSLDELRLRMVRDLELFLSYALAPKGEARPAKMAWCWPSVSREARSGGVCASGGMCAWER